MAWMAVSIVPWAVITMTWAAGDSSRSRASAGCPRRRRSGCATGSFGDGQEAGNGRTPAFSGLHVNGAPMLLEDAMAERQPEPEPALLGGEEGIEDPGAHGRGDAGSLVAQRHLHHRALPSPEIHFAVERVEAHPRREREAATRLHGVDRV